MSDSEAPTRIPSIDGKQDKAERGVTTKVTPNMDNAQRQRPKQFSHSFWDPKIAHLRALYFKITAMSIVLLIIVVWACLPVYWGSLWKAPVLTRNLRAWVIDRDGQALGNAVAGAIMNTTTSGIKQTLGWQKLDASMFPTNDDVALGVVDERAWVAVVIAEGATAKLAAARANGDATYDPTSLISVYYSQARNEVASGIYLPLTQTLLIKTLFQFNAQSTAQYLAGIAGNQTAIQLLARAPQTISTPAYFTLFNLRPYTAQVATAVTLVGFIYVIILSFFVTMSGAGAREVIAPYLTTASLIKLRLIMPIILYFPLSLIYSMISLPFKLPFGAKYTYAGGFFLFWVLNYVGMLSLGLATEFALTLLTQRFVAFFLIPFIVINVSVSVLPHELQPWFYKYGYGFPVFNLGQAVRTIIFNTKNHLGRNFGVLIAWAVLSLITVPIIIYVTRQREIREEQAKTLPDEREEEIREEQRRIDFGAGTTAQLSPSEERRVEEAERQDRGEKPLVA
ncbi:hypothetical protein FRC14_007767 [Serendipita sp. 396]|nr:hypothetical protein FRC14_007767 [Serendipita sp. 396]KAG8773957.1 hypothetical protein FRC15_001671 [Serendipita sp. 397]KAG8792991.1 hypothetical protein FRC16_011181 [Serendipita sp. 398]KAG8852195.1 hypothetical protein FRC20_001569 [Serendipita sp. 405]